MTDDDFASNPEIVAMARVSSALSELPDDARGRVLRWAVEHFGVSVGMIRVAPPTPSGVTSVDAEAELAELFATADAQTEADKALVAGYWIQFVQGESDFDAQTANAALKHLGHGIGNITRAFDSLKSRRPQLVIQLKKAGTSRQARKKYRITVAGKAAVEEMLQGGPSA